MNGLSHLVQCEYENTEPHLVIKPLISGPTQPFPASTLTAKLGESLEETFMPWQRYAMAMASSASRESSLLVLQAFPGFGCKSAILIIMLGCILPTSRTWSGGGTPFCERYGMVRKALRRFLFRLTGNAKNSAKQKRPSCCTRP